MHSDEIQDAVRRVVESGWYLQGKENETFERHYAQYIGTDYCVGCANGLDALTLMMRAYIELGRLKPGDEVIVPANTYIATILAITENHLVPVLVEPHPDTLQIDDSKILDAITSHTRAIMIVHLYGRCAYTNHISDICKEHQLLLFEDNAQAHGCMFEGRRTGSLSDAAAHSFYPGKNLGALGDGGAVTTNDASVAETVRTLANYGSQRKYVFQYQGRNSRLDELQAAVLDVKLRYLDQDNEHRRQVADIYISGINNPAFRIPKAIAASGPSNVFHIFPLLCGKHRDALQQHLLSNGIQTMIHYPIPPHHQQCYAHLSHLSLPITEAIANQELSLPIAPYMTADDANRVVDCINQWV